MVNGYPKNIENESPEVLLKTLSISISESCYKLQIITFPKFLKIVQQKSFYGFTYSYEVTIFNTEIQVFQKFDDDS